VRTHQVERDLVAELPERYRGWLDALEPTAVDTFRRLDQVWEGPSGEWMPHKLGETALGRLTGGFDGAERRAAALWVQLRRFLLARQEYWHHGLLDQAIGKWSRRRLDWRVEELEVLWQAAIATEYTAHPHAAVDLLALPLMGTEGLDVADRGRFEEHLWWALRVTGPTRRSDRKAVGYRRRIEELLASIGGRAPEDDITDLITGEDGFAELLRSELPAELTADGVPECVRHWRSATTARPTAAWIRRAREVLSAAPSCGETLQRVLARLPAHREKVVRRRTTFSAYGQDGEQGWVEIISVYGRDEEQEWAETVYLDEDTANLLRGMLWTLELIDGDWPVPVLGDVAVAAATGMGGAAANARSEVLANAAVKVLAKRPEDAAVAQLARVQAKAKKKTILKGVSRALDAVAARTGLTRDQLLERTVPAFGLGPDGTREERAGGFTAVLSLDAAGTPALRFRGPDGKARASVPKAVREGHPELLAELRATVKEMKKALPTERFRIEAALADGRTWTVSDWRRFYLEHPITGAFARALIWECSSDGGQTWRAGSPVGDVAGWSLVAPTGETVWHDEADKDQERVTIRLWHPIRAEVADVRAWRDRLYELELRQPFKQAFREIYLLTPAEERTHTYSNRFAGHVLKYGQAKALLQGRDWSGLQLGYWEGGYEGEAAKELGDPADGIRWRAQFYLDLVDTDEAHNHDRVSFCASDQVRFDRNDGTGWEPQPLTHVPPLLLSEIMRDVDLAVGVASIAADPEWTDRGEDRYQAYWREAGFGALGESAKVRREVLSRLLPRTKIAGQVELTDRFLRVKGSRRTYKIHLGSGNILMEPNDAYLCIVAARDQHSSKVFLPFEDERLALILSKAFLLADDTRITDETILLQIREV
jgi:hypothetical protein